MISAGRNYAMTEPNLGLGLRTRLLPAEKAVKNLSGARQPLSTCVYVRKELSSIVVLVCIVVCLPLPDRPSFIDQFLLAYKYHEARDVSMPWDLQRQLPLRGNEVRMP